MRTVFVSPLGKDYSVLGFGCASLGSRISARQGQNALARAFEHGVTWYDVAPPYGDGNAEGLLGTFLEGRRDRVAICTKVGIPRVNPGFAKRVIRPAMRLAIKAFPRLRQTVAPLRQNMHITMPPEAIENSVIESLRLLRTDYIDVLALHEPTVAMCEDPAILNMLQSLVKKGYVRALSIAGGLDAIVAGSTASQLFSFAQFQDNPFLQAAAQLRQHPATQHHFMITHSVFGSGALQRFTERVKTANDSARIDSPSDLLFDYALAQNQNGIVLSSMFSQKHSEANCAQAAAPVNPDAIARVQNILAQ
jgi:aryl-alcohol dehydrogenase-like predicted oxidoreductase